MPVVVPDSDRERFVHACLIMNRYSFPGKLLQAGFVPDLPSDAPHGSLSSPPATGHHSTSVSLLKERMNA